MKILRVVATALALAVSAPALATQGAVNLAAPTGSVQTTSNSTATNLIPMTAICGATSSATLYAACANQVFVNASGQLGVTGPVTQSGTWTVQPGNTPNSTAWLVTGTGGTFPVTGTFWQSTQPVSAASLPLPTGASTSANQPTNAAQGSTTSGQTGPLLQGAATTGAPTDTTGDTWPLSLTTAGGLRTDQSSWGGTAITNVPTAVGTAGTGNTPTVNAYIVGGAGSGGTAGADAATWTAGTTNQTPIGCEYTSGGATALVTAHMGTVGCTTARGLFSDLSSEAGTAITSTPTAYGTAPTGNVIGVNANVTNTNANGQAVMASSSPVVIASDQSNLPDNLAAFGGHAITGTTNAVGTAGTGNVPTVNAYIVGGGTGGGAVTLASGAVASGAYAAGSISAGAAVSGAFVAGSIADLAHGQGTMAASVPVAIASNQSSIPVAASLNATPSLANGNGTVPTQGGAVLSVTNPSFTEVTDGTNGAVTVKAASTASVATDKSLVVQINPQQTPAINNAQVNGVTILAGAGATGTGSQRVTAAQDTTTVAGAAPLTTGIFVTGPSAAALATSANQTNASQKTQIVDGSGNVIASTGNALSVINAAPAADPCSFGAKTNLAISTNATALTQIIAASGSTKIYICSIVLVAPAATAFNLNTGTGTNCGTSTAALIGSTTAANGMSFAARQWLCHWQRRGDDCGHGGLVRTLHAAIQCRPGGR